MEFYALNKKKATVQVAFYQIGPGYSCQAGKET
jgi:hypothetical protein